MASSHPPNNNKSFEAIVENNKSYEFSNHNINQINAH